jgi:acetyl-CoA synthetase
VFTQTCLDHGRFARTCLVDGKLCAIVLQLVVLGPDGQEQEGPCEGFLCIKSPWPGIARTVYGDHKRYEDTYFKTWRGLYTTGDGCRRDSDGYIWITGRIDDVLNVR